MELIHITKDRNNDSVKGTRLPPSLSQPVSKTDEDRAARSRPCGTPPPQANWSFRDVRGRDGLRLLRTGCGLRRPPPEGRGRLARTARDRGRTLRRPVPSSSPASRALPGRLSRGRAPTSRDGRERLEARTASGAGSVAQLPTAGDQPPAPAPRDGPQIWVWGRRQEKRERGEPVPIISLSSFTFLSLPLASVRLPLPPLSFPSNT